MINEFCHWKNRLQLKPDELLFLVEQRKPCELRRKLEQYKWGLQNWTLRDVRRNISRKETKLTPLNFACLMGIAFKWGFTDFEGKPPECKIRIDKVMDKLISLYGHKALVPDVIDAYLAKANQNHRVHR